MVTTIYLRNPFSSTTGGKNLDPGGSVTQKVQGGSLKKLRLMLFIFYK